MTIFFDTNIFIYLFEDHPEFGERTAQLYSSVVDRGGRVVTSTMTLGEILVKPLRDGDLDGVDVYKRTFLGGSIGVLPFDAMAALRYAEIRRDRATKRSDAIQLACAAATGVDLFLTNDDRLTRRRVEGINFISSLANAPL